MNSTIKVVARRAAVTVGVVGSLGLGAATIEAAAQWTAAAVPLMTALYDDGLASAVGIAGPGSDGAVGSGHWSASEKMKAMIGYSAVTDATGFGNTAIQALFHGGDALGAVEHFGPGGALAPEQDSELDVCHANTMPHTPGSLLPNGRRRRRSGLLGPMRRSARPG